jgi:hypothetical protein
LGTDAAAAAPEEVPTLIAAASIVARTRMVAVFMVFTSFVALPVRTAAAAVFQS